MVFQPGHAISTQYVSYPFPTYVPAGELDQASFHALIHQVVVGAVCSVELVAQLGQVVGDVYHIVEHRLLDREEDVLRRQLETRRKQSLLSKVREREKNHRRLLFSELCFTSFRSLKPSNFPGKRLKNTGTR